MAATTALGESGPPKCPDRKVDADLQPASEVRNGWKALLLLPAKGPFEKS
jgi:hypothetical protein